MAFAGAGSRRRKYSRKVAHRAARAAGGGGKTYFTDIMAGKVRRTIAKMKACRATASEVADAGYDIGLVPSRSAAAKLRTVFRSAKAKWNSCRVR